MLVWSYSYLTDELGEVTEWYVTPVSGGGGGGAMYRVLKMLQIVLWKVEIWRLGSGGEGYGK
jgi:uncharacterized membrane protein